MATPRALPGREGVELLDDGGDAATPHGLRTLARTRPNRRPSLKPRARPSFSSTVTAAPRSPLAFGCHVQLIPWGSIDVGLGETFLRGAGRMIALYLWSRGQAPAQLVFVDVLTFKPIAAPSAVDWKHFPGGAVRKAMEAAQRELQKGPGEPRAEHQGEERASAMPPRG